MSSLASERAKERIGGVSVVRACVRSIVPVVVRAAISVAVHGAQGGVADGGLHGRVARVELAAPERVLRVWDGASRRTVARGAADAAACQQHAKEAAATTTGDDHSNDGDINAALRRVHTQKTRFGYTCTYATYSTRQWRL
jgi:hypothetical protein